MFCTLIDLLPETILKHVMAIVVVGYAKDMRIPTSGKNHFHEMNGDVGMAGWK